MVLLRFGPPLRMDHFCSEKLRLTLLNEYPRLGNEHTLLRLFVAIIYPPRVDSESGRPLIARPYLARLEGKYRDFQNNRYVAADFLHRLQEIVGRETFSWQENRYTEGKCREAILNLPASIREIVSSELRGELADTLCCIVTGKRVTRRLRSRAVAQARSRAAQSNVSANTDQRLVLDYLNSLPTNSFQGIRDRVETVRPYVLGELKGASQESQLRALRAIAGNPVPVYSLSSRGHTDRLFAVDGGLLQLRGNVRRMLCDDLVEVDVRNAQLAIVSKLWDVPEIGNFLRTHGSVWPELLRHLKVEASSSAAAEVKDACKNALYSVVYGRDVGWLKCVLKKELGHLVERPLDFVDHWIIELLLDRREHEMRRMRDQSHAETCYGRLIKVSNRAEARSALAQQAQAVELKLMTPLYRLAIEHPKEFRIMLHQHDGVSIKFTRREGLWRRRLEEHFNEGADLLGVETTLDWKDACSSGAENRHTDSYVVV